MKLYIFLVPFYILIISTCLFYYIYKKDRSLKHSCLKYESPTNYSWSFSNRLDKTTINKELHINILKNLMLRFLDYGKYAIYSIEKPKISLVRSINKLI